MIGDVSDLDINRQIRQVLVRFWIDLGRLSIRTTSGRVMLRGLLQKIPGSAGELSSTSVSNIFNDINRIKGVKRAHAEFTNWVATDTGWQSTAGSNAAERKHEMPTHADGVWRLASEKNNP